MTTDARRPYSDEWLRHYFQQVFGREVESRSELDRHVIEWLNTAMRGPPIVHLPSLSEANGGGIALTS